MHCRQCTWCIHHGRSCRCPCHAWRTSACAQSPAPILLPSRGSWTPEHRPLVLLRYGCCHNSVASHVWQRIDMLASALPLAWHLRRTLTPSAAQLVPARQSGSSCTDGCVHNTASTAAWIYSHDKGEDVSVWHFEYTPCTLFELQSRPPWARDVAHAYARALTVQYRGRTANRRRAGVRRRT